MRRAIFPILVLTAILGCSGGSSHHASTTVSGSVVMGAPVAGATVSLYAIDAATRRLTRIASGTTAATGSYSLAVPPGTGALLLLATGGTYKDDATGATCSLSVVTPALLDDARPGSLEAIVAHGDPLDRLHLTPATTMAARRVALLVASQGAAMLDQQHVDDANKDVMLGLRVGAQDDPIDARTLAPLDYTNPSDAATIKKNPLSPAAAYGAVLSGLSKLASDMGLKEPSALIAALAEDFSDGVFDGMHPSPGGPSIAVPAPSGVGDLSPTATTGDLAQATTSFLGDPAHNLSGATPASLGPK